MVDLRDRVTYVYIDLPNLLFDRNGRRELDLSVLLENIGRFGAAGTEIRSATLYAIGDIEMEFVQLARTISIRGVPVNVSLPRRRKDIDVYMVNDIWQALVQERDRAKSSVRHIIVSGDADFVRVYRSVRSTRLLQSLDLEVVVYSWQDNCSFSWRSITDRIHYLDDIPHISGTEAIETPLT